VVGKEELHVGHGPHHTQTTRACDHGLWTHAPSHLLAHVFLVRITLGALIVKAEGGGAECRLLDQLAEEHQKYPLHCSVVQEPAVSVGILRRIIRQKDTIMSARVDIYVGHLSPVQFVAHVFQALASSEDVMVAHEASASDIAPLTQLPHSNIADAGLFRVHHLLVADEPYSDPETVGPEPQSPEGLQPPPLKRARTMENTLARLRPSAASPSHARLRSPQPALLSPLSGMLRCLNLPILSKAHTGLRWRHHRTAHANAGCPTRLKHRGLPTRNVACAFHLCD